MDQIKREQELLALRQLVEQTYANSPGVLDALRRNENAFDLELRNLPPGASPEMAFDHLRSQQWFRQASEPPHVLGGQLAMQGGLVKHRTDGFGMEKPPFRDAGRNQDDAQLRMKRFETHLPPLTPAEVRDVLGHVQRVLDARYEGHLQVTSEALGKPDPQFDAVAGYASATGVGRVQLTCQLFTTCFVDASTSICVSFIDQQNWQPANEQIVGATMHQVDAVLRVLMEPPPGVKMWLMTAGAWETGVYFDSDHL